MKSLILSLLGVAILQTSGISQTSGSTKQQAAPAAKVSSGATKQTSPSVKPSTPTQVKSTQPQGNQPKTKAAVAKPAVKPANAGKANPSSTGKVKKDGTPDRRFKENKKLKKDGTPDMRFKDNKQTPQKVSK